MYTFTDLVKLNIVSKRTLLKYINEYKAKYPNRVVLTENNKHLYPDDILIFINDRKNAAKDIKFYNLYKDSNTMEVLSPDIEIKDNNKYITKIKDLMHEINDLKRMISNNNEKINSLKGENAEFKKEIVNLSNERDILKNEVTRLDTLNKQYIEKIERYRREIDKLLKLNEYLDKIRFLEDELRSFKLYNEKCENKLYIYMHKKKVKEIIYTISIFANIMTILFFMYIFCY